MSCWFVYIFVFYPLCAKAKSAVILSFFCCTSSIDLHRLFEAGDLGEDSSSSGF